MLMYMVINRNKKKDLVVVDYILGDLPETYFLFRNNPKARAEDLNKFHFGVVGKSF